MSRGFHPLVKQVLDGERALNDLPPELRAEAAEALRMLGGVDRRAVTISPALEARVMAAVRAHAASPGRRAWRWLLAPSIPPWAVGALAAAGLVAALVLPGGRDSRRVAAEPDSVYVKFLLYAPAAHAVALAGTFNQWDPHATPLVRVGDDGVWTVTVALPAGQHQYGFVVDGGRWVTDPAAPTVDDGFGRRNSIMSVSALPGRVL